jgi:hypothetical protein
MYTPIIAQCGGAAQFVTKIKNDYTAIHSDPNPPEESVLIDIHEHAETWLLKFAQKNILMVPGNLRAALQTFEGDDVEDISQRCTYTMQHDPTTLLSDLREYHPFVNSSRGSKASWDAFVMLASSLSRVVSSRICQVSPKPGRYDKYVKTMLYISA